MAEVVAALAAGGGGGAVGARIRIRARTRSGLMDPPAPGNLRWVEKGGRCGAAGAEVHAVSVRQGRASSKGLGV